MRTLRYVIVDVFTQNKLEGNPLAVFTGTEGLVFVMGADATSARL